MAKIPDYQSTETFTPHSNAADAGAIASGIYEGIGSGLHAAGEALTRFSEQQETSQLAVKASALHATLTNEWEDLKTNGNITDPETVQKFNEHVAEATGQLLDGVSSPAVRNHAAEVTQTIQSGFTMKTVVDHSTAVGAQAVTNLDTMIKNYSSSVYMDPQSLDETAALIGFSVAASGIPQNKVPELALKARNIVAKSAVEGMIENGNPQKALEELAKGSYDKYFDGPEKTALASKANQAIKAQEADERAAAAEARRKATDEAHQQSQQIVGQLPVDDKGHIQIYTGAFQEALKIKDAETQRSTLDMLRSVQSAGERTVPKVSDTATYDSLRQRIFDPEQSRRDPVTQNELMRAYADGKLDDKDFTSLRHGLAGDDDPATKQYNSDVQSVLNSYKSSITDSSLIKVNQYGDQRFGEFQRDVDAYARTVFKTDGANAAAKVEAYARSRVPAYQFKGGIPAATQAIVDKVSNPLAPLPPVPRGVEPRKPGESIADYTKRTGGL